MTLQKRFLHSNFKQLGISRLKFIIAILIGLLSSFAFYSFLYMFRETFRYFSITEEYDLWVLTDKEVNFYNLFFAFVSVIFGLSICIQYWVESPRRFFEKQYRRRSSIVNDQRILNWNFFNWFCKISLILGIMFCFNFQGWQYQFPIYPKYNYLFWLIIIVLFLQIWNTIRLTFNGVSLKWLLISIVLVTGLSLGFSRINLIDYKSFNNSILKNCVYTNYNLELPKSSVYSRAENWSLIQHLYVVTPKNKKDTNSTIILAEGKVIRFENINAIVANWSEQLAEYERAKMTIQLHIHSGISMKTVNSINEELSRAGVNKIAYAIVPSNISNPTRFYSYYSLRDRLLPIYSDFFDFESYFKNLNKFRNIITINQQECSDSVLFNNRKIEIGAMKDEIKNSILSNSDYIVKLYINDNSEYWSYISILTSIRGAIDEIKNEYSISRFQKEYEELDYNLVNEIDNLYPTRIAKITEAYLEKIKK